MSSLLKAVVRLDLESDEAEVPSDYRVAVTVVQDGCALLAVGPKTGTLVDLVDYLESPFFSEHYLPLIRGVRVTGVEILGLANHGDDNRMFESLVLRMPAYDARERATPAVRRRPTDYLDRPAAVPGRSMPLPRTAPVYEGDELGKDDM